MAFVNGPIGCLEASVKNYHYTLCNVPKDSSSYLLRSVSTQQNSQQLQHKLLSLCLF